MLLYMNDGWWLWLNDGFSSSCRCLRMTGFCLRRQTLVVLQRLYWRKKEVLINPTWISLLIQKILEVNQYIPHLTIRSFMNNKWQKYTSQWFMCHDGSSIFPPDCSQSVNPSHPPSAIHPSPPAPSSPTHDHQGLEWDPSVDIGRSVSCDDASSSYFSASTGRRGSAASRFLSADWSWRSAPSYSWLSSCVFLTLTQYEFYHIIQIQYK